MKNCKRNSEKKVSRFKKALLEEMIRDLFSTTKTAELARKLGVTEKMVSDFVYREKSMEASKRWTIKDAAHRSKVNRENALKRWAKVKNKEI